MKIVYLDLADLFVIAAAILDIPADGLLTVSRVDLAESALHAPEASFGDVEFYPSLAAKAAVLCVHLVKNHPLPDGNKRLGFIAMIEFLERNGCRWTPPSGDSDGEESAQMILDVAAGKGDDAAVDHLASWISERILS